MSGEANLLVNATLLGEAWLNAELAMLVVDENGRYVATNKHACTLTGYSHQELTHLRAGRDLAGDEPSSRIYEALERERRMQGKKLVRTKGGELVRCRYWGIRTTIGRLPYFVLLLWPPAEARPS
jgi:PAS domain S-box-containing protein